MKSAKPGEPVKAVAGDPVREAIDRDNEAAERRRIRTLLRLPMTKRTHFLRVKVGPGSAL